MLSATPTHQRPADNKPLRLAALVIVVGVLSTYLAQTHVMARIPLQNLLKNALHVDRSANAEFFFWMILPWYFKPLVGIVSDAFPLFGSRRRSYLIIGAMAASAAWFVLWLTPRHYGNLLAVCMVINVAMVVGSTVVGGYMVEIARSTSASGRLTSVRNVVEQFAWVLAGPAGGFLASIAFGWTALVCGGVAFLIVPIAFWLMRERYTRPESARLLHDARHQLVAIVRAKTMWAAAGLAALFYFAPGVMTAVFYAQQNDLHLTTQGQGFLTFLNGVSGVLAASLYGLLAARRFTLRTLLIVCLLLGTAGNLAYLFYTSVLRAEIIESVNGFGYTLAEVAMMHLAVRATPAGSEALGFSLMMAVRNLGLFGSDWFGSHLLDQYHVSFHALVFANGATSFLAVPLVLLLPAVMVDVRDTRTSTAAIDMTPAPARVPQE
jgi:predicted MFS family arabinose efflux permease